MSDVQDPLLRALRFLGQFHGLPLNLRGAVQGLPIDGDQLTPRLFVRAARRAGLEARIVERRIEDLSDATCPAVLLLNSNEVAIMLGRTPEGDIEWLNLDEPETRSAVSPEEAKARHTGFAILVRPAPKFEERSRFEARTLSDNWFWGTLLRFKGFYGRVIVATVMINVLALTSSLFVMNVYDRVVPNQATDTLWVLAAGALGAYVFEFILKSLRTFFVDRAGHRIDLILGSELFARVLGMRFGARPESAGALAGQARSYEALREFFASATVAAFVDLPFVFVFAFIIYLLGGITALPLVIGALAAIATGLWMQIPIGRAVAASYQAGNQRQALFVEGLQALETVKATRTESQLQARMEQCVHVSAKAEGRSRALSQLALNLTAFFQHLVSTAIVIVAYFQVKEGLMSMGAMIACVILAGRAMAPLGLVASLLTRLQQSFRALEGLNELMRAPLERDDRGAGYVGLTRFEPSIEFDRVTLSFGAESRPVLENVSFTVAPAERVAILGRIGSGKSSLLRLLLGLYPCSGGTIYASGIALQQIDPAEWRRQIGYVSQDPSLLYGTIRSNLTSGCPGVDEQALWQAIARAGLDSFIRSLPRGLDQPVAEGGRSLSGGQRQALCLARALIEEPPLLILDEPTSAMDQATERHVLSTLDEYLAAKPDRTLLLATHKRSTLALAQRVLVLENGRIVADGPKEFVVRGSSSTAGKTPGRRTPGDPSEVALPSPGSPSSL